MSASDQHYDDLTQIKGIGKVRQTWLRESLGVRTYSDLAALSVTAIEQQLKAEGKLAARQDIAHWIERAQALAVAAATLDDTKPEVNTTELVITTPSPTAKDGWQPSATFVVEFQSRTVEGQATELRTTVHHMEADKNAIWPGIEDKRHCEWMLEQLGDEIRQAVQTVNIGETIPTEPETLIKPTAPEESAETPITKPLPSKGATQVTITEALLFQSSQMDEPMAAAGISAPLIADEPFGLQVSLAISGESATILAERQVPFQTRTYAYETNTGNKQLLGDSEPDTLVKDKLTSYKAVLSDVTLSPGVYRLFVTAVLAQTAVAKPAFIEIPQVKVV